MQGGELARAEPWAAPPVTLGVGAGAVSVRALSQSHGGDCHIS